MGPAAILLVLSFAFLPLQSHAQIETIAANLRLKFLCSESSPHKNCSAKSLPQTLQLAVLSCDMTVHSAACQELATKEPSFKDHLRHCDPQQFCNDYMTQELMSFGSCGKGYAEGTKEIFKQLWDDVQKKNKLLQACDLACKRTMAQGLPEFVGMSDAELTKYPATALSVKKDNYDYAQSMYQRQSMISPLLSERAERAEAYDKQRQDTGMALQGSSAIQPSIALGIRDMLEKKGARLECMDTQTRIEMICWGAAYVVDPTILLGAAFKGVEIARYISTLMRSAEDVEQGGRALSVGRVTQLVTSSDHVLEMPQLPASLSVSERRLDDGTTYLMSSHAVTTPTGEVKVVMRELPVDKLTGAFDANYSGGREFLQNILKDKKGDVSFAFVDVNNLGYVNKNFAKGVTAGDEYFKNVTAAIKNATNGKADLFRLGGDELGLVIYEKDPKKVQAILDQIMKATYSKDVQKTFRDEKIVRANQYKADQDKQALMQFVPYSKQGISMGATQVGASDDLSSVLARAESQAQQMKIQTKEAMNIDASKYGGAIADDAKKSNQSYVPQALPLQEGTDSSVAAARAKPSSLEGAQGVIAETRDNVVHKFGDVSVVQYKDEMGNSILRSEKISLDSYGHQQTEVRELPINEKTGFVDGTSEQGKKILAQFVQGQVSDKPKSLLWLDAKSLGEVNYFAKGSQAGDALLEATSAVIKKQVGNEGIPFKIKGSEFVVALDKVPADKLAQLQAKISNALAKDPTLDKIFGEQRQYLLQKLAQVGPQSSAGAQVSRSLDELNKLRGQFSLNAAIVEPTDTLPGLLYKMSKP